MMDAQFKILDIGTYSYLQQKSSIWNIDYDYNRDL